MKLTKLQKTLRDNELDGCILYADDPNFKYYVQEHLESGMLFVPKTGTPTIFVHPLEEIEHDFNIKKPEKKNEVKDFFKKQDLERIGYNPDYATARRYFKLRNIAGLKGINDELREIRLIKTKQEILYLEKAARIADDIMQGVMKNFDFRTEGELKRYLKTRMAEKGVEQSFEPIVASELGAATPHYFGDKKLKKGFLIIDMGVKWKGYCSDITRTFYIGKPKKEEKELYEKVLRVQEECIDMCLEGDLCSDSYDHAKDVLGEEFSHGLGHGIGVEIHELPNLKPNSDRKFKEGMVFTVEPGWYDRKKKVGIRIEDDLKIHNGKPVRLTKTTKELVTL